MRLVKLPVFVNPREHNTKPVFVNADQVFFVTEVEVPTVLVEPGPSKKPVTRPGTLVSPPGGAGLMVDLLLNQVLYMLQTATSITERQIEGEEEIPTTERQGEKEVQEDGNESAKSNKGRVRQGSEV